jgi:copper homeostasis protein
MLEIACFNAASAITAASAGADRVELCSDYAVGGLTPPVEFLRETRQGTTIPINVMIRPRPGDFIYSEDDFIQMKSEIQRFKPEASGFVFGILDDKNHVDEARNTELVKLAAPLPCTFHRAFDQVSDMSRAVQQLIECGFASILTSGGQSNAMLGAEKIAELEKEWGHRIKLILGGGVRSTNIEALKETTKARWYHSAAIIRPGEAADAEEITKLKTLQQTGTTDSLGHHLYNTDGQNSATAI